MNNILTAFNTFLKKETTKPLFTKIYAIVGVCILLATTVLWATLGALANQSNADQLVDPLLFHDTDTFGHAAFPGAHTFLFKWPLFLFVSLMGYHVAAYVIATVATTLITIAALAYMMRRLEKRNIIFGTLCLGLASILLFTPIAPSPGALLPVNMAMLTTRNLEYVLYIIGIWLVIHAATIRRPQFWIGVGCLALLFASDKLFLTFSLGGAILALITHLALRKWQSPKLLTTAWRWLLASIAGGGLATGILWAINALHITTIVDESTVGPYPLIRTLQDILFGAKYLVLGIFSNFGIDLHSIGVEAIGASIHILLLAGCAFAVYKLLRGTFQKAAEPVQTDEMPHIWITLFWSSVVAVAAFVATNH